MNAELINNLENAYSLIIQSNNEMISAWLKYTLFTWRWWVGVMATIVPWVVWILRRKKDSTERLLLCGLFVIIISSWLDVVGILFGAWSYYYNIVPLSPAFIPWDFTLLPVTIMSFLQFKPRFSPIIKAVIFGAISAFVIEPLLVWANYYHPKYWSYYYSFPIFAVIYLMAHWISRRSNFAKLE